MQIVTNRLVLRSWQDRDRAPFAALSADPAVMQYLLPLDTREASDAWIDRQIARQAEDGFCFWAVETKADQSFVGSIGLVRIGYSAPFTPAVEIGWRITQACWGRGYAPEAAKAALRFGFDTLQLPEIVANAAIDNENSQKVMRKLGMMRDPADDFDHPRVAEGHSLRRQVLYRLGREQWKIADR